MRHLRRELHAIYLAARDPRVPWYAKALIGLVIAYALSPIDLIPDFIPVIGLLDDLVLVPLGILLVRRMIPAGVLAECRARADEALLDTPRRQVAVIVAVVALAWILGALVLVWLVARMLDSLLS